MTKLGQLNMVATTAYVCGLVILTKIRPKNIVVLISASKDWKIKRCQNHWAHECDEESRVPGCHCLQNAGYHDRAVADPSKWF